MRRRFHLQRQPSWERARSSRIIRRSGFVVTADGSFGELKRENYVPAEEKTVQELKKLGKPFLVLLNSQKPYSEETRALAARMTENYEVQVLPVNCEQLRAEDIREILGQVLLEFPVTEIDFSIPKWLEILPNEPLA